MRVGTEYPQLRLLLWNRTSYELDEAEAFALYEAHRQWIDPATMTEVERAMFDRLVATHGRGVFLG